MRSPGRPFVCLTPNPAIDRIVKLNAPLTPGRLHRVAAVEESAGGKGMNVARILKALGAEVLVAGFLAGHNGEKFESLLASDGLSGLFEPVDGETRECQILIDGSGHPTEVNDPGPTVGVDDWRRLLARLPTGRLVVSGSLPPGLDAAAFGRLLEEAQQTDGSRAVVDTSGPALVSAVDAGVALIKPNASEVLALIPDAHNPLDAAREAFQRSGVPILLTLGADGAALIAERSWLVRAPEIVATNPVASGDCLLAAYLWASHEGWSAGEALRLGVAAGAENARTGGGGRLKAAAIYESLRTVGGAQEI